MSLLVLIYPISFGLSLMNPRWGFIGLIATVLIRPPDRIPALVGLPGYELLLLGILLGMVFHADKLNKPSVPQDALIAWLFGLSIVGLMIQASGEVVDEAKQFVSSIFLYIFATRLIRTKEELLSVLFWLSAITIGLAVEAVPSYMGDPDSPFIEAVSGRMQGLGYYANPNEFGKLMCTAIPFVGIFVWGSKSISLRALSIVAVITMIAAVGLTQSRTCFVALAIIAVTPTLVSANEGLMKRVFMLAVLGAAFVYTFSVLPGPLQERMQSITNFASDDSFLGRVRAWGQGVQMVTWYPLYGVGKGQWYSYHGLAPHNSFVQVMAEMGIPGILIFCRIVWVSWIQVGRAYAGSDTQPDRMMSLLGKGIAASYLGYLFYIFLGNQGYSPWTYFYFGICAAYAHIATNAVKEARESAVAETAADNVNSTRAAGLRA